MVSGVKDTVWIVADEDPRPDDYIPIFVRPRHDAKISVSHRIFSSEANAILFATELTEKYHVNAIRIFHPDGHSERILSSD